MVSDSNGDLTIIFNKRVLLIKFLEVLASHVVKIVILNFSSFLHQLANTIDTFLIKSLVIKLCSLTYCLPVKHIFLLSFIDKKNISEFGYHHIPRILSFT